MKTISTEILNAQLNAMTLDLLKDQSPGFTGNPDYLTMTRLRRRPCASHDTS